MSRPDPKQAAESAKQNLMRLAIVVFAVVGVMAFFILTGRVDLTEPIELKVAVTQPLSHRPAEPLELQVAISLVNNTEEPLPLALKSQCDIFRWFVTDKDQNLIQSQRHGEPCLDLPVNGELDAKHSMSGNYTIALDPQRITPGNYILFMRYWGYESRERLKID